MRRLHKGALSVLGISAITLVLVWSLQEKNVQTDREQYAEYITNHPFANRDIQLDELSNLPKFDRPDLAAEHNFLQIVDPKLGRIPTERLALAYEETKKKLSYSSTKKSQQIFNDDHNNRRIDFSPLSESSKDAGNKSRAPIANVSWAERGPNNVGGRTRALMWDPNDASGTKLWAGATSGGIWFNNDITNASSSWVNVDDFLASLSISDISYDPNTTTTFYAGTGEGYIAGNGGGGVAGAGLYKSTDGGSSWTLLSSTTGPDFRYIQKVLVSPSSSAVIIATRQSRNEGGSPGIFRSTDGGDTWTRVISGRGADLELASNGDIYASTGIGSGSGQVWRSTDDGVNWTEVTPPGGNPLWIELAVAPSQSSETSSTRIYALAQEASSRTSVTWFQRSDDGGATWTDLPIPNYRNQDCTESSSDFTRGQAFYDLIVAVQPNNADVVTMGGIDIYRSLDAGANMELVSYWTGGCDDFVHADQHEAVYRPGFPNEAVFGHDGGVSYSSDVGNPNVSNPSFDTRNNNYGVTQFYAMAARNEAGSNNLLAGAQDNGTQRFTDGNGLATSQAVGGDGAFCHIDQTDGTFQIASVQFNSVRHSSNGGASFVRLTDQNTSHGFINPTDLDNQSHILYTAASGSEYMIIRDINSASPATEEFVSVSVGTISHINADSEVNNRLYIGSRQGSIYRIDDANTSTPTVTEITGNITSTGNVSSVSIGATDDQLVATFSNFGVVSVWLTLDGGTTWTSKDETSHGLPDIPVRWSLINPNNTNEVLLATELGVWSTDNILADNPEWEPTSTNLANVRCDMLQYRESDGNVFVATFGRGVFSTDALSSTQDTTPPSIIALSPTDGSTELFLDIDLEVTFNESITLGTGNVSIIRTADNSVFEQIDASSSSLSATGAKLIINPSDLEPSTAYHINIDNGLVQDSNGNSFAGISDNTTWNIETFDGDFPPELASPIGSVRIIKNSEVVSLDVDLSGVFTDPNNDASTFTYSITSNDNPSFIGTSVSGSTLTLTALVPNQIGAAQLTLEVNSNGKTAEDVFTVTVRDRSLFDQTGDLLSGSIISMQMTDEADTLVQLADDFIVPEGEIWNISTIAALGRMSNAPTGQTNETIMQFAVQVYGDSEGAPDDSNIIFDEIVSATFVIGQTNVDLPVDINGLEAGSYWISVFAISPIETARWNWLTRVATEGEWHINDRLGFFGLDPGVWIPASSVGFSGEDVAFAIEGTLETVLAPSDLVLTSVDSYNVALTWVDNADNETGYIVERSTDPANGYTEVATLDPDSEAHTDTETLDGNTTYHYRITATGSTVNSAPATGSILMVPNPPEGLTYLENTDFFSLRWTSDPDIETYKLDISTDNFTTFYDNFEDSTLTRISSINVPFEEGGIYSVRMRAVNESGSSGNSEVLEVEIAILGVEDITSFELYPNPAQDQIFIQHSEIGGTSNEKISLTSLSGKVSRKSLTYVDDKVSIDISDLPSGIYILNIEKGGKKYQQRFIKR